jgi:hypothetical protein
LLKQCLTKWFLIRPGEGGTVAYLAALYLVIGLGMALGRSSSDALFFKRFGVQYLPHMLFLTSILLVFFSAIYAEFVDRVRPWRMFQVMFLAIGAFLIADWVFMRMGEARIAFALYFLGYGVISELIIVHFNLYISGFLDALQSKRLFPLINASSRLGAVCGGLLLGFGGAFWPTENMAVAWAALVLLGLAAVLYRHRGERRGSAAAALQKRRRKPFADIREGMRFARNSPLLRVTGIGVFIMIVLVSMQDYLVSTILTAHFHDERSLAAFFGWFFAATNAAVLLLQLLTTNRLLQRFGLKTVNLIFPWSTIASFALLSVSATFIPALVSRFNYMGMLPAFRNPVANLFYSALPAYMQGRARALTIGLILPLGLAAAGLLLVLVPRQAVGEPLALLGLFGSLVYLYLKNRKNRVYGKSLIELIQHQVFSHKAGALDELGHLDGATVDGLAELMRQTSDEHAIATCADILLRGAPQQAGAILTGVLPGLSFALQDRLLREIARLGVPGWMDHARDCLVTCDAHLRATMLELLTAHDDEEAWRHARDWLRLDVPRLRAAAASAMVRHNHAGCNDEARKVLLGMLSGGIAEEVLAALAAIQSLAQPGLLEPVRVLTQAADPRIRAAAIVRLGALSRQANQDCRAQLEQALHDPEPMVRSAAIDAATTLASVGDRLELLARALQDRELAVRQAASAHAAGCMPVTVDEYRWALAAYFSTFGMQSLLCQCLAHSELAGKRELLMESGRQHMEKAYDKKTVAALLERLPPQAAGGAHGAPLLALVLGEDIQRHLGLVLEILQNLDEGQSVRAVRAALSSRDRRLRAQAVESVRHSTNDALLRMLLPLLEAEYDGAAWRHPLQHTLATLEDARAWCLREGSTWLRECAAGSRQPESTQDLASPV